MPFAMRQKSTQGESGIDRLFLQQSSLSTKFVESLHSAFRRGPGGSEARVDVLSLLSVYYIFCQGSTKDKVKAIFSLFDFNRNGSMSQDELTIMFISSFYGICGYLSLDLEENIESICERMAFETFRYKHNENPQHKFNSIDHIEFLDFLQDRIDTDNDGISAVEIVRFFQTGVVPQSNVAKLCVQEESELGIKYENDFDIETQYSQGDEFMAIRPWLGAVKSPSKNIPTNNSIPDASLELDWVYGYRCYDVRNNLRYVETGEIVYPCAAVVVLFDPKTRSQNFLQGHDDDVVSLDISKDRTKIVTGETGRHPCLMVWHAKSRKLMTTLRSRSLRRAVVAVSFSKSGNRVVAVGQDDRHTVHVFCLNTGICMAKCPTERTRVMTCLFVNDENVILGGLKHARHLILRTNASHKTRTQSKRLLFGKIGSRTILCSQNFQDMIVCGTSTGELIVWDINKKSREPVKLVSLCKDSSINNQDECVNALWCSAGADSRTLLYAGSKCGRVWILNRTFDIVQTYDIKSSSSSCSVRSVCVTPDEKSILVGTQGGEIIEISSGNDKEQNILIESHFYGETRGLAVHPRKLICATSGDDKTVRVWDMKSHKQLHITMLNSFVRSLAYSPSGHHLACGTGGRFKGKSTGPQGHVVVLDTFSMKPVRTLKDSKKWIRVLTYSPDGSWLAVGSQDYNIYIYDTDDEYRLRHVLRRHNSHVSCLDFTEDSKHLRSVCGGNELLFWDARRGKPMPGGATSLRDATWHTTTCPLVWSTQGILDTDPKSLCVSRNERCDLVVSGDSKGVLSLLNYPCPKTPWCRSEFLGHGSYIPCVRFTRRDVYVVSVGGADRGIFQWRVQRESSSTSLTPTISSPTTTKETYELEQYEGKGDNLMASKPWLGAIKAPSEPPNIRNENSSSYLELAWVHGCSTRPRSVQYLSRLGVLAYSTAAIVVLHELNSKSQNYFRGYHTGRINSMAFSNDETICATGGVGRNPSIYIWCTRTRKIVTRLEGHRRSIDALAFSPNKQYLVSVGGESNRLMFLYERT
jgi:WD40 repeat protein